MTATNELRRMLDERGVMCVATDTYRLLVTSWNDASGHGWAFMEHRDGSFSKLTSYHLTPAQAIAATLGSGTCHYEIAFFGDGKAWFACSECGGMASADYDPPKYCPHCGRKVVGE